MLLMLVVALFHFYSHKALSIFLYTGRELPQAAGDRFFTSVRTGGEDPQYRKSWATSIFVHIFILIILPWLLGLGGCVEDYRVPKGSGQPVVAMVRVVKPKKVEKKTYILNPHSAISFYVPNLDDDSEIEEQIKEMIEKQYEASNAMAGKMGAGGGTTGGWPDGMEDHEVRFIPHRAPCSATTGIRPSGSESRRCRAETSSSWARRSRSGPMSSRRPSR